MTDVQEQMKALIKEDNSMLLMETRRQEWNQLWVTNAFYMLDMAIYSNVAPKIQVAAYLQNNQQVLLTVFFVTNLWL